MKLDELSKTSAIDFSGLGERDLSVDCSTLSETRVEVEDSERRGLGAEGAIRFVADSVTSCTTDVAVLYGLLVRDEVLLPVSVTTVSRVDFTVCGPRVVVTSTVSTFGAPDLVMVVIFVTS